MKQSYAPSFSSPHMLPNSSKGDHWILKSPQGQRYDTAPSEAMDTARHLLERKYKEPLDPYIDVQRSKTCQEPECVNPAHFHLQGQKRPDGKMAVVPYLYWMEHHDEVSDLVDLVLGSGVPLTLSTAEIRARVAPDFSVAEYDEALKRIQDQNLF